LKRFLQIIVLFFTLTNIYGQAKLLTNINVKEVSFYYKDSINGQITFGDYNPTGIISLKDGSLIISTEFSIHFPGECIIPDTFTNEYFERQKIFKEKSHTSSGSVFMLNDNLEKQWEVIFKDRRVEKIKKLSDESIIAVGESVDLKFFWVAKINKQGKIIYDKSYKFKSPFIQNIEIDSLNNLYILLTTERLQPIRIIKYYNRRHLYFFRETEMEDDLYLLKLTPSGKIKWKTAIDKRKNISAYGYDLIIEKDIYLSTSYNGFIKEKGKWREEKGRNIYQLSKNGKILDIYQPGKKDICMLGDKLIFSTSINNDTLCLYLKEDSDIKLMKTIVFNDIKTQFWIKKSLSSKYNNYILGTNDNHVCIVIEFDKQNKCTGYWKYDNLKFIDATIGSDNSIVFISDIYSNLDKTNRNKKNTSIKLTVMRKPTQ